MHDVIVVGGGILGMSVAYHLVRAGTSVLVFDRHDTGRATAAGAGILAAPTYSGDRDAWMELAVPAYQHFPQLVDQLRADQAGPTGYAVCGKLIVAATGDEIGPFRQAKAHLLRRQQETSILPADELAEISPREAREMYPPLAEVHSALYFRRAARVDGRLLASALQTAAQHRGLEVSYDSVQTIERQGRVVRGVRVSGELREAEHVVIAGGAWSDAFEHDLDVRIPIEPQRGQIVHLSLKDTMTEDWPIVTAFRHHYLVAWPDHRVVAGATWERGAGFRPQTTACGVKEVLDEALRVAPGLSHAAVKEIRVGLRPRARDDLPVVGRVPTTSNAYVATGHGGGGLQTGPYSGKIVADLILGRVLDLDLAPYALERFAS